MEARKGRETMVIRGTKSAAEQSFLNHFPPYRRNDVKVQTRTETSGGGGRQEQLTTHRSRKDRSETSAKVAIGCEEKRRQRVVNLICSLFFA